MIYASFIPPVCNIITITKRTGNPRGYTFKIIRNDGKEFDVFGNEYRHKEGLLTIRINANRLPIILEVSKEFLIIK